MSKLTFFSILLFSGCFVLASCGASDTGKSNGPGENDSTSAAATPAITAADWGEADGKKVQLFTLTNKNGVQVKITNYGGIITSWLAPDNKGGMSNIVLGFDSLSGYLARPPYFGATIGRYGNRIGDAKFTINGQAYTLAANNGKNNLHGGEKGFDKVVWDASPSTNNTPSLSLSYLSKDGEEGFPGNLKARVTFTLTDSNEVQIAYDAETDKATPVNLTNHSYFNLSGDAGSTILNHTLWVNADRYTPVDSTLIPTGTLAPVKGTPFDFTQPHLIGERIAQVPGGYDHNFVLNRTGAGLQRVAWLQDTVSGRQLDVFTTEPGLQFYSGNFLDGSIKNRDGKTIPKHGALCLETQHFPDSPNKPSFPSTILQPGEKYHSETTYKVSVIRK